jgi:hypothetical protein
MFVWRTVKITWICAIAMALLSGLALAQDVKRLPSTLDRAHVGKMGWSEATASIGDSLRKAWKPGRSGLAGSSGSPAFQSWLLMARWAELMGRNEADEVARFIRQSLVVEDEGSGDAGRFYPPGFPIPADARHPSIGDAREFVNDPAFDVRYGSYFLPPDFVMRDGTLADRVSPEFAQAMVGDERFLKAFFESFSAADFTPAVLESLSKLYMERRDQWDDYLSLAIALAVVYDQRLPEFWPHHQVAQELVPRAQPNLLAAFDFWVAAQESKSTLVDIRTLGPDVLKFVVDAPVEFSELEWAQENTRFPRTDWGRAFSSIKYVWPRIEARQYDWPGERYLLSEIQSQGGICVDQAYFAMLTGKARGLPTLYFSGQGSDGGHAWFGYLRGEGRWDMDCGRYENQNYATGEALDPQTWRSISDHELQNLAQSFRRTPAYVGSSNDIVMAELFEANGDSAAAGSALESAIATSPRNPEAWQAMGEFLVRSGAPMETRTAHHEAAIKQFANDNDLRVYHQTAHAALATSQGDTEKVDQLQKSMISQNRRDRSDLSIQTGAARVQSCLAENDVPTALRELRGILSRFGETAGGNIFYEIIRPTVWHLRASGDEEQALRVIADARRAIRPEKGGILDVELSELEANDPKSRP